MEFPELGSHCSEPTCHKLDFLPVKCDACGEIFCHEHMSYMTHNCPKSDAKNVQVPVCPLCNKPVPSKRGEMPDIAVGAHIDRDCQSDPAKNRRKVFSNKCTLKGCKKKELLPMICKECGSNFCITHRHPVDHSCTKQKKSYQPNGNVGKVRNVSSYADSIQGQMTEDEALAHAIALSLEDSENPSTSRSNGHSIRNVAGSLTEWTRRAQKPNSPSSDPSSCNMS